MSETSLENLDTALADEGVVVEPTAPAEPQIDAQGRAYATGKRKNAIARVWIKPGSGVITVNGSEETKYFARPVLRMIVRQPLVAAARPGEWRRPVRPGRCCAPWSFQGADLLRASLARHAEIGRVLDAR